MFCTLFCNFGFKKKNFFKIQLPLEMSVFGMVLQFAKDSLDSNCLYSSESRKEE